MVGTVKGTYSSKSLNDEFRSRCHNHLDFEFNGLVATTGAWPFTPQLNCDYKDIPELATACALFEQQYNSKHNGRKLTWLHQLGRVEMRATFGKGETQHQYQLSVSAYQAKILTLFDEYEKKFTINQIVESTSMRYNIVEQILAIFLKTQIMVLNDELYSINDNFTSKRYKLNLNYPLKTEIKQDKDNTDKRVGEDRAVMIMATIVRIMKGSKTATAEDLIAQVISMLEPRFKAKTSDIKRSIEACLEKEYLIEAESTGPSGSIVYKYLA